MTQFSIAFEKFLSDMNKINDTFSAEAKEVLKSFCDFLGIARIEIDFYTTSSAYEKKEGTSYELYADGEKSDGFSIKKRFENHVHSIIEYTVYRKISADEWNEKMLENIELFIGTLFVYNSRSQLIKAVSDSSLRDSELEIHNLQYYLQYVAKIINKNMLNKYFGVYFNLKSFSVINHQFGREKGTEIMRKYVKNLSDELTEDEIVCRVGGDNFVGLFLKDNLEKIKAYLRGKTMPSESDDNYLITISTVAGAYMINGSEIQHPSDLMDKISTAFHTAKGNGSEMLFFDSDMMHDHDHAKWVESQFPYALDAEEFKVYYQPKIDLNTNRIVGAEALCRWFHEGKIVPPYQFIPILEQTLNICTLDFYMLDHVCRDIRKWLDSGKES
ncbi:MAG: EAL domain-containing protein, partial [Firmicutes bacterium]|nr:EAL domain-containing protein [Bacillota bacterium]